MPNTVTLTRIDSGFANVAPTYLIGDHADGTDCHQHLPREYVLPDGYWVGISVMGEPTVYDEQGGPADICPGRNWGKPTLVTLSGNFTLRAVVNGEERDVAQATA